MVKLVREALEDFLESKSKEEVLRSLEGLDPDKMLIQSVQQIHKK